MATETEEPTLTVDELAARAGVTVRTIRFYSTRGLLPPPVIGPRRVGHYGSDHVSRLALIEELQHQGMTLAAIERYLGQLPADLSAQDLAIHRALVASWAPESAEEVGREELERRAGRALSDQDVAACCGSASSCWTCRSRTRRSSPPARSCWSTRGPPPRI
jgi:DNA-binding transcriptional MerR regulator